MYVVRRPFRNVGQMVLPGSIVEPGNIKFFKARLRDRVIIEVSEHNLDEYDEYFKAKFGVSLKPASAPAPDAKPEVKPEVKSEVKPDMPKARIVAKAT